MQQDLYIPSLTHLCIASLTHATVQPGKNSGKTENFFFSPDASLD